MCGCEESRKRQPGHLCNWPSGKYRYMAKKTAKAAATAPKAAAAAKKANEKKPGGRLFWKVHKMLMPLEEKKMTLSRLDRLQALILKLI